MALACGLEECEGAPRSMMVLLLKQVHLQKDAGAGDLEGQSDCRKTDWLVWLLTSCAGDGDE